jgi:arabinofuranan 3-O-arabinosyltransferase
MPTSPQSLAPGRSIPQLAVMLCFALAVLHIVFFPAGFFAGVFIFDRNGLGDPTDFINVYAAGRMALEGDAALAYDWDLHKQVQVGILGRSYAGHFAWHYPPPFLFVASALACLPYAVAYAAWPLISLVPFLLAMRAIVGRSLGLLLALGFPVVLTNVWIGQNGFLTAALVGGALLFMPTRPIVSGICLGLLTYKPQYGVLFPLVLIATAQWRVFVSASLVALLLAAVSWLAFGTASWLGFIQGLPLVEQAFLSDGRAVWGKLQSVFATVRYFGGGKQLAWLLQIATTVVVAAALVALWRSRARYAIKAAALAAGVLLATPYLFFYDVMVLAIAVAFLVRDGLRRGFQSYEWPLFGLVFVLLFGYLLVGAPTGLAATLVVLAIVAGRCGLFVRGATAVPAPASQMSPG